MLVFGIRYLCENVVASDAAVRTDVEWPPHPARVFMAMAAAHFQTGNNPAERAALEWLERQTEEAPPYITSGEVFRRRVVTSYVPVNDSAGDMKTPVASAPGFTRLRQPRTFAKAWLEQDIVWLSWPTLDATNHVSAIGELCAKVTRIGHSSSLVQMWISSDDAPPATWIPDPIGKHNLRVMGAGSLLQLEEKFNREAVDNFLEMESEVADENLPKRQRDSAKSLLKQRFPNGAPARLRPDMDLSCAYRCVGEDEPQRVSATVFDPRLVTVSLIRRDGPFRQLGLAATLELTSRCREALLAHLNGAEFEELTGHNPVTKLRSDKPHLAIVPLAFIGHEHSNGGILGLGFALPENICPEARQAFNRALAGLRSEPLLMGPKGSWFLGPTDERDTFRPNLWTGDWKGADLWATVTPFVYDRHSKAKEKATYQAESAESIRAAWENVKRRENSAVITEIIVTPVSAHLGALPSHAYPRLRRKDNSECRHCHAILRFDRPITGPLLLGAGRYRGYGLCRPM